MGYADVIWSSCDKEALYTFLKLQMPTAGIVLYTNHLAPSVTLFTKLEWIPFYGKSKINKCAIFYKHVNGSLPNYLNELLTINNTTITEAHGMLAIFLSVLIIRARLKEAVLLLYQQP